MTIAGVRSLPQMQSQHAGSAGTVRDRRRRVRLIVATLAVLALATCWIWRLPMLRGLGHALVVSDSIGQADVVVIGVSSDGAGVLEAVDLVHAGMARRVAVFEDPPDAVDREFLRRGVPYEDAAARSIRQLASLGVTQVVRISAAVGGTEEQGARLPRWCEENGVQSLIVVTTADHSRRLRRVLHRAMDLHRMQVAVRPAAHSPFQVEQWWQSREGIRIAVIEWEKLLLDVIRHPFAG
jgi:hypothetical protein